MRILFDHDTPRPLKFCLPNCTVDTAFERGLERLKNSKLLDAAERDEFELLIAADKGFLYQQNLKSRRIAVIVLSTGQWPDLRLNIPKIVDAIKDVKPGTCQLVECMVSFQAFIKEQAEE